MITLWLYIVGPPESFTLMALSPRVSPNGIATLRCDVEGLDQRQLHSYHWQWKFQERYIKENSKYKVSFKYLPCNLCQQSEGWIILQIANVSNEDLGQYMCVLQLSNITFAEKDISVYELGKLPFILVFRFIYLSTYHGITLSLFLLVFVEEFIKTGEPRVKPSKKGQEPTAFSTPTRRWIWESIPGHITGRRALSPMRHSCFL